MINRLLLLALFVVLVLEPTGLVPLGLLPGVGLKNVLLYLLVILLCIRAALSPKGFEIVDLDLHFAFLALILYAFVSWFVCTIMDPTYDSLRGFFALKRRLVDFYLIVLIFRYGVDSLDDMLWLLRAAVGILLFLSGLVLLDYLSGGHFFPAQAGRLGGFVREPNQYGALVVFFLPIAVATTLTFGGRASWLARALIGVTILLLLATASRGAFLSQMVGPFIAAWYLRRWVDFATVVRFALLAAAVFTVLLLFAVLVLQWQVIIDRLHSLWEVISGLFGAVVPDEGDGSTAPVDDSRFRIWSVVFRVMLEWPMSFLVGYGWFSYGQFGIWKSAHSEYVDILFNLGLVGLLAFVLLLAILIGRTRAALPELPPSLRRLQIGYVFGLVSLMMAITFVQIPVVWPLVFVFVGLMSGIRARGHEPAAALQERASAAGEGAQREDPDGGAVPQPPGA